MPVFTANMSYQPRIGNCYGMPVHPLTQGATWLEGEMWCTDYGQFRRRGLVRHSGTKELVRVRADVADTFFSIPATTDTEHGYVTGADSGELEFRPHTSQEQTPAQFRKELRKAYK